MALILSDSSQKNIDSFFHSHERFTVRNALVLFFPRPKGLLIISQHGPLTQDDPYKRRYRDILLILF